MATINYDDPWIQQKATQQFGNYSAGDAEGYGASGEGTFGGGRQSALDYVLFGEYSAPDQKAAILAELDKQGAAAGLPADYDWTPHLVAASQQHWDKYNQPFRTLETPRAAIIAPTMVAAAQTNPELAPYAALYQPGSDYWNQSASEQQARLAANKRHEHQTKESAWTTAALMVGGGMGAFGGAEGAGGLAAEEAALAGGGSAGMGAGGSAAAATGTGAVGYTAAEEAAMLGAAETGGTGAGLTAQQAAAAAAAPAASGTGSNTGTQASNTGTNAAKESALQRLLAGNGTASDYASLLGTGFDIYGAYAQREDTKEWRDKLMAMGEPYRNQLATISADPNAFYSSPTAQKAQESVLQRLSATHGNPAGSPYAQALTIDSMYDNYGAERDRLAGYGGLTAYNQAGANSGLSAIGANANLYNSISGGLADLSTPKTNKQLTLADYLRAGGSV